jgi:hypothetical protein
MSPQDGRAGRPEGDARAPDDLQPRPQPLPDAELRETLMKTTDPGRMESALRFVRNLMPWGTPDEPRGWDNACQGVAL